MDRNKCSDYNFNLEEEKARVNKLAGEMIKEYRKKRGMNQSEIASTFGASPSQIGCWERAERNIDLGDFWCLIRILGISPHEFVRRCMTEEMRDEELAHRAEWRKRFSDKRKEFMVLMDAIWDDIGGK